MYAEKSNMSLRHDSCSYHSSMAPSATLLIRLRCGCLVLLALLPASTEMPSHAPLAWKNQGRP